MDKITNAEYNEVSISYFHINMEKVLQATSRGQITLPKKWREKYDTKYFVATIDGDKLELKPLKQGDFAGSVEDAWTEYKSGEFESQEQLMEKYGL